MNTSPERTAVDAPQEIEPGAACRPDFVMVRAPDIAHAGHVGDEVTLTDRTEQGVYVLFYKGIRECYSTAQFSDLFSRLPVDGVRS